MPLTSVAISPVQDLLTCSVTHDLQQRRYVAAGDCAYVIGTTDGDFPPMGWHIRGEMGGVWAQPIKLLDGYWFALDGLFLPPASRFTTGQGYVQMEFLTPQGIHVTRTEFAPDGLPAVLVGLTLSSQHARTVRLSMDVRSDLLAAYPWDWTSPKNTRSFSGQDVSSAENDVLLFRKPDHPWFALVALAAGEADINVNGAFWGTQDDTAEQGHSEHGHGAGGQLSTYVEIPTSGETTVWFVVAGSHISFEDAFDTLHTARQSPEDLLQAKIANRRAVLERTQITIPDDMLQAAFDWGKLNLADLRMTVRQVQVRDVHVGTAYPAPAATFDTLTGIAGGFPDYCSFFGTDGAYSVYSLLVTGQWDTARGHLRAIRDISRAINGTTGKVIHEMTPDGAVFYGSNSVAGNTNETAQFAIAVELFWRWSGDDTFRDEMYDFVCAGLRYALSVLDPDGDGCPSGRGMVERDGMAEHTLDVAAYTWQALNSLAHMAASRDDWTMHDWAQRHAYSLYQTFGSAWWMPEENLYADSLDSCIQPQIRVQQLHWINAVPLEVALVPLANANAVLDRMESVVFTGENGLYHTGIGGGPDGVGEPRIWTLPNSVMSVAEANYGRLGAKQALHYMRAIAAGIDLEMPGALPEVLASPDYNPFAEFRQRYMLMQAWSSYGIHYPLIHHMLGISPFAPQRRLFVVPQLPPEWHHLSVSHLRVGDDELEVVAERLEHAYRTTVDVSRRWTLTIGHTLLSADQIQAVCLDGIEVNYRITHTTRGQEVHVQTSGGALHTLEVLLRP